MDRDRDQPAIRAVDERSRADEAPGVACCPACGAALELARCGSCGAVKAAGGLRVLRLLAESDHARVYLAEDASGQRVALKELIFARAPSAQTIDAFERETALLQQLDHPAIPRFVKAFREGDGASLRLYLAQEHVEGMSLERKLEGHRFTESEVESIARQVLEVLRYLHGLSPPVVHRDLKPANLIVRPDGRIALVDFGIAREVSPRGTYRATSAGTFGFMAPEALGGTVDRTADLYGLGATMVHLLSRRPPEELLLEGASDFEKHINASPGMIAVLRKLTALSRAQRYQSAAEVLAALEAIPSDRSAPNTVSPARAEQGLDGALSGDPDRERERGRSRFLRAAAVGLTAFVAAVALDRRMHNGFTSPLVLAGLAIALLLVRGIFSRRPRVKIEPREPPVEL